MKERLNREIYGLVANLRSGARLITFRPVSLETLHISTDQSALLVGLFAATAFIGSYLLSLPAPELSVYGIATIASHSFSLLLASYVISKTTNNKVAILPIFVALLVIWTWLNAGWMLVSKSTQLNYWQYYEDQSHLYLLYNVWIAAVFVKTVSIITEDKRSPLKTLAIYLLIVALPLQYPYLGSFWQPAYDTNNEFSKYQSLNEEDTYYKQFKLLEAAKSNLLQERHGVSDIYFIGFGGYAYQDVFMKEVQYARNLFDRRYDTEGRSIALINNIQTINGTPLASKSNLDLLIRHIGSLMNPEEDVLFLYLTSHGSASHELSASLMPLNLNQLRPKDLKNTLDKSNIRYRVLLISSCYSGGFIEPLKDDYTVIVTASASTKQSFGCSNKSDFTHFGKAVFEEQLQHNYNFIDAFEKAIKSVQRREKAENLESSEPQMFVGQKIRWKLESLYQEIKEFNQGSHHISGFSNNDAQQTPPL